MLKNFTRLPRYFIQKKLTNLPEGYKKFFKEWQQTKLLPVHYIPKPDYERNPKTGEVLVSISNIFFVFYYYYYF